MKPIAFAFPVLTILLIVVSVSLQAQTSGPAENQLPIQILFPKSKTYVTQNTIKMIGLVNEPSIQQIDAQVTGGQIIGNKIISVVNKAFEVIISLRPGQNEIIVSPSGKEEPSAKISIFLKTEGNVQEIPGDFSEYFLHQSIEQETTCQNCHRLDITPISYQRMNVMESTCQTEACHGDMGNEKYVHGPVGSGTCIACHNPHGSSREHYVSRDPIPLCMICHESMEGKLQETHVHGVIISSGCISCHDSHESPNKFQLIADTTSNLCYSCHDSSKSKEKIVHGPVAAGDCNACHDPHASPNDFMLPEAGNALCFLCHDIIKDEMNRPNAHKPVQEACTKCHDAHGAANAKLLGKLERDLCFGCHIKIQDEIQLATVHHKPVADGDCVKCHEAHGSGYTKLLQTGLKQVCFECHKDIGQAVSQAKYRHGPVQEDDCYACHLPHGSANPKILVKFFPEEFYNPYKPENYALCFECHNQNIALDEFTTTLTDFRNGNQNLHYLHVHKTRKGRSCKACHEVHASNQDLHIRTEVPYGKMWSYPISFAKAENGGTCVVGCHKPKDYNRVKPVVYE